MAKRKDCAAEASEPATDAFHIDDTKVEQREIIRQEYETFRSFAARHGNYIVTGDLTENRPGVIGGRLLLFEDGAIATSTHHRHHGGREPATDLERLGNRWRYLETKLRQEREDYNRFMSDCIEQQKFHQRTPTVCAPPPTDWKDQAERGKARIEELKTQLKAVLEELERTDPELIARRQRNEARQKRAEQSEQELNKMRAAFHAVQ